MRYLGFVALLALHVLSWAGATQEPATPRKVSTAVVPAGNLGPDAQVHLPPPGPPNAVISANGTFTIPPGVTTISIWACGGGGGGSAGSDSMGSQHPGPGGGGGAGARPILLQGLHVNPGDVLKIEIGTPGPGGTGNGGLGGNGGNTTVYLPSLASNFVWLGAPGGLHNQGARPSDRIRFTWGGGNGQPGESSDGAPGGPTASYWPKEPWQNWGAPGGGGGAGVGGGGYAGRGGTNQGSGNRDRRMGQAGGDALGQGAGGGGGGGGGDWTNDGAVGGRGGNGGPGLVQIYW